MNAICDDDERKFWQIEILIWTNVDVLIKRLE